MALSNTNVFVSQNEISVTYTQRLKASQKLKVQSLKSIIFHPKKSKVESRKKISKVKSQKQKFYFFDFFSAFLAFMNNKERKNRKIQLIRNFE